MTMPVLLDTADEVARWLVRYGVTPRQIRDWARRGRITRHPGGHYSALEVAEYLERRPAADKRRAAAQAAHCAASRRLPP